jgi:hypothetical protein
MVATKVIEYEFATSSADCETVLDFPNRLKRGGNYETGEKNCNCQR